MAATHAGSWLQAGPRRAPELARRRARPASSCEADLTRMARSRSLNSLTASSVSSSMTRLPSSRPLASRAHSLFLSLRRGGAASAASERIVISEASVQSVPTLLVAWSKMLVQQWWWAAILAWVREGQRHWVWQSVSLWAPQSLHDGDADTPH